MVEYVPSCQRCDRARKRPSRSAEVVTIPSVIDGRIDERLAPIRCRPVGIRRQAPLHRQQLGVHRQSFQLLSNLVTVDRIHHNHVTWAIFAEEFRPNDLLAAARHELPMFARIDIDDKLNLICNSQGHEKRHPFGSGPPHYDPPTFVGDTLDPLTPQIDPMPHRLANSITACSSSCRSSS